MWATRRNLRYSLYGRGITLSKLYCMLALTIGTNPTILVKIVRNITCHIPTPILCLIHISGVFSFMLFFGLAFGKTD